MMASKFLKSSIALLLARGALGATDVADSTGAVAQLDALLEHLNGLSDSSDDSDEFKPKEVSGQGPLLGALLMPHTPCTAIYGNAMRPTVDGAGEAPVMEQIVNYLAKVTGHDVPYAELTPDQQSEFLILGWSGMCFPVDGRCDQYTVPVTKNGKTKDEVQTIDEKKLRIAADRKKSTTSNKKDALKSVIQYRANEIVKSQEFQNICKGVACPKFFNGGSMPEDELEETVAPRAAYRTQTLSRNPRNLTEFWKAIGNGHFAAVSAFSNGKPTWLCAHEKMQDSHYQVDVGSGKAVGFKLVTEGKAEIKGFGKKRTQVDFHVIRKTGEAISPGTIMKYLEAGAEGEALQMLQEIAAAMFNQFKRIKGELCNQDGAKPKVSFGVTGIWREGGEALLNLFDEAIQEQFAEHCECVKVFVVDHADEARYGALSWLKIPGFVEVVRKYANKEGNKFRYVVSIEAGKNSTQVGVIDLDKELEAYMPLGKFEEPTLTRMFDDLHKMLQLQ